MASSRQVSSVLNTTFLSVRKSRERTAHARLTVSQTAFIIDRSRQLLSAWPVNGTPLLREYRPVVPVKKVESPPVNRTDVSPASAEPSLERIHERDFREETVRLDGRHFIDCNLTDCTLEYCGGPVMLEATHFAGCRFRFGGEAAMTVSVMECFSLIEQQGTERIMSSAPTQGTPRVN